MGEKPQIFVPAKLTFSQVGIIVAILVYLAVRVGFALVNIGFLWTQPGGYFAIALPLIPVILCGFTACVIAYAYSYLGFWLMDHDQYILGAVTVLLSVIVAPGTLAAYSWIVFPPFT